MSSTFFVFIDVYVPAGTEGPTFEFSSTAFDTAPKFSRCFLSLFFICFFYIK
jgi:hypothetical protein